MSDLANKADFEIEFGVPDGGFGHLPFEEIVKRNLSFGWFAGLSEEEWPSPLMSVRFVPKGFPEFRTIDEFFGNLGVEITEEMRRTWDFSFPSVWQLLANLSGRRFHVVAVDGHCLLHFEWTFVPQT